MRTPNHHHVLIVDDDEDDRYILLHAFREIHWNAPNLFFDSGESLFRYLEGLPTPELYPSLILLDFSMPRMGAADILVRLKAHEQYGRIKVGVYSTGMTEVLHQRLKGLGACACYQKSADMSGSLQLATLLRREAEEQQTVP